MPARIETDADTPWFTSHEAAAHAKCSVKVIYQAVKSGKLKAAKLGARNDIRIHEEWLDAWLQSMVIVNPNAPGSVHTFRKGR